MARSPNDGRGRIGGRKKGTPNRATEQMRDFLTKELTTPTARKQWRKDMASLSPKDRLTLQEKFLSYIVPKRQEIETDNEGLPTFAELLIMTGRRKKGDED